MVTNDKIILDKYDYVSFGDENRKMLFGLQNDANGVRASFYVNGVETFSVGEENGSLAIAFVDGINTNSGLWFKPEDGIKFFSQATDGTWRMRFTDADKLPGIGFYGKGTDILPGALLALEDRDSGKGYLSLSNLAKSGKVWGGFDDNNEPGLLVKNAAGAQLKLAIEDGKPLIRMVSAEGDEKTISMD